jgi:hypothetical protein
VLDVTFIAPRDQRLTCSFCNTRLRVQQGQVQGWRSTNGRWFCTEFCADDADELAFQRRRPT